MTRSVYKYEIYVDQTSHIDIPKGAEILHLQSQGDHVCMWVLVDTEAPKETRMFNVFGTGWPIEELQVLRSNYVGTAMTEGGRFVWHVFEYV